MTEIKDVESAMEINIGSRVRRRRPYHMPPHLCDGMLIQDTRAIGIVEQIAVFKKDDEQVFYVRWPKVGIQGHHWDELVVEIEHE